MTTQFRAIPAIAGIAIACSLWADEARYDADNPTPQETFERICSQCHPSSKAVPNSRSAEEWAVLVKRMQGHAQGGDKAFHDQIAATVTVFLTAGAAGPDHDQNHGYSEEHNALEEAGEALGITTAVLIATMIATGALRRKIGRTFRMLHGTGAVLLVCALAGHATILFLGHATPNSLWHLCGTGAFILVVVTTAFGLARRRIGQRFLRIHAGSALLTAALALLHRLLA